MGGARNSALFEGSGAHTARPVSVGSRRESASSSKAQSVAVRRDAAAAHLRPRQAGAARRPAAGHVSTAARCAKVTDEMERPKPPSPAESANMTGRRRKHGRKFKRPWTCTRSCAAMPRLLKKKRTHPAEESWAAERQWDAGRQAHAAELGVPLTEGGAGAQHRASQSRMGHQRAQNARLTATMACALASRDAQGGSWQRRRRTCAAAGHQRAAAASDA